MPLEAFMWEILLAGTAALTLIGGSLSNTHNAPVQAGSSIERQARTPEERAAFTDARISALKTELHLTTAQEKNWGVFEATLRDTAKKRAERFEQFRKSREQAGNPVDRDQFATQEAAEQKKLAAALDPLYKSLDDGQKQRFASMFRIDGEGRHFWFKGQRRSHNVTN